MTKTEYAKYLSGNHWQERRKAFLQIWPNGFCNRCYLPRWLASLVYDQDLHVHHKSYANLNAEKDEDLESLCRRCHELETFGKTTLRAVKSYPCCLCKGEEWWDLSWDPYDRLCASCLMHRAGISEVAISVHWEELLEDILRFLRGATNSQSAPFFYVMEKISASIARGLSFEAHEKDKP